MSTSAEAFLAALGRGMDHENRMILCGFPGDPNKAPPDAWKPRPFLPGRSVPLHESWNAYVAISTFKRSPDNTFRRRTDLFAEGLVLMVDDVGTKVKPETVAALAPSIRVLTSPGNEQFWYLLDKPCTDRALFDATIKAFIRKRLLGNDPGMNGVNRVGRIPDFINAKAAYGGAFRVEMTEFEPDRRYPIEEFAKAFELDLVGIIPPPIHKVEDVNEHGDRIRAFVVLHEQLKPLLKRSEPDPSGWFEITCPWVDEHSGRADTGAALRRPSPENEFFGAFRCHHGHCADRGLRDVIDLLFEQSVRELQEINLRPITDDELNAIRGS